MLSLEKLKVLYDKYSELVDLEVEELGCKPTEVRHLIGRLGEFFCALHTKGELAHEANQHGFDVISASGRRVSVKTTAQKRGFIRINERTVAKVDDLMLLQYADRDLQIIYFGPIEVALTAVRKGVHWELDITKARKLMG